MKQLTVLLALLVLGSTLLLSVVSTAYLPVPYFDQRLSAGPLSKSELAYLRRLTEDSDVEVTTTIADPAEEAPEGAFTNSCVGEADESSDSDAVSDDEEAPASYGQSSDLASDST